MSNYTQALIPEGTPVRITNRLTGWYNYEGQIKWAVDSRNSRYAVYITHDPTGCPTSVRESSQWPAFYAHELSLISPLELLGREAL